MGIVILKKDKDISKSYEEAKEIATRRYLANRNKILYRNLRKFLQDASKATQDHNNDEEYNQLQYTLYGVQRRISELEAKGCKFK